jgi:hypothetical protein
VVREINEILIIRGCLRHQLVTCRKSLGTVKLMCFNVPHPRPSPSTFEQRNRLRGNITMSFLLWLMDLRQNTMLSRLPSLVCKACTLGAFLHSGEAGHIALEAFHCPRTNCSQISKPLYKIV